jgi:hypothetical protein
MGRRCYHEDKFKVGLHLLPYSPSSHSHERFRSMSFSSKARLLSKSNCYCCSNDFQFVIMPTISLKRAQQRVIRRRILGAAIMLVSLVLIVCAILKSIYFLLENDVGPFSGIAYTIRLAIHSLFQATHRLPSWELAPLVDPRMLNLPGNYGFIFLVSCLVIGRKIWDSAARLSSRITERLRKVEERGWERELMGQQGQLQGARPDVLEITIALDQEDEWYKRPVGLILLAVAGGVLLQWLNLKLGLAVV